MQHGWMDCAILSLIQWNNLCLNGETYFQICFQEDLHIWISVRKSASCTIEEQLNIDQNQCRNVFPHSTACVLMFLKVMNGSKEYKVVAVIN